MQGTYPLFVSNPARIMSRLGAICRPIEGQLQDSDAALEAMGREVRAHSPADPLFVKFARASWLKGAASRRQHREAAWDIARAALTTDIGRTFCAEAPWMVDDAWARSGMPQRGQPITLRQVIRLARLVDYLYVFSEPRICDGSPAKYQEACKKLAIALTLYERHADDDVPAGPVAEGARDRLLSSVVGTAWEQTRDLSLQSARNLLGQASMLAQPSPQALSTRPAATASAMSAAPAASAGSLASGAFPAPASPSEPDFRTPPRTEGQDA